MELSVEGAACDKCACVTCSQMAQLEVSAHDAQARAQASASRCTLCEGVRMMRRPAGRCARMWACAHTRACQQMAQRGPELCALGQSVHACASASVCAGPHACTPSCRPAHHAYTLTKCTT
ncbi:hypothetical protein DUNSADRAFT_3496 [Dunaliella salina]|uniref:Uncharacterized protein n=1 Tax=Dunaliella salina TaxID=3046 RepID=A0ABQ7FVC4_DUNSA|nr:hypothetical protein DUNSADRAFT_3496 [Dunaliella salina]|eukprot:KAF5826339.1 hypothetical protein DUNSADRAFT_3496 [Dunaliella salina]